ncbi:MAG: chitosanase, partial [Kribbellaceae bacterium]|nr:chitosanase [Kribbellaceae bacterium]
MFNAPTNTKSTTRRLTGILLGLAVAAAPATAYASPLLEHSATQAQSKVLATAAIGLDDPAKKEIAMQLVSSAENSSLDWKAQYKYIEDIGDGRGYTAGIIGFCSGTGDMVDLVELYKTRKPGN